MEQGHRGHQQEVQNSGKEAQAGAVLVHNGGHAVGVAGTDENGLGVDDIGKMSSYKPGQPVHQRRCHHVAQQHGPGIQGV